MNKASLLLLKCFQLQNKIEEIKFRQKEAVSAIKPTKRKERGFTLIEIMIVISLLMGISVVEMKRMAKKGQTTEAINQGRQIELIGLSTDDYMTLNENQLKNKTDPNCVWNGDVCRLNFAALNALGGIGKNVTSDVKWGGQYEIYIRRKAPEMPLNADQVCVNLGNNQSIPLGCPSPYPNGNVPSWQYALQSLIITSTPWTELGPQGGGVMWQSLGEAVKNTGPHAGMTKEGKISGLKGTWELGPSDFGNVLVDGQLAFLGGEKALNWSSFVRRDGAVMTGNLDMGGYKISGAKDVYLNGADTNPKNKSMSSLMPNWIFKGVYAASDGDFVPEPSCSGGGVPKIKIMMQLMQNEKAMTYGTYGPPKPAWYDAWEAQTQTANSWEELEAIYNQLTPDQVADLFQYLYDVSSGNKTQDVVLPWEQVNWYIDNWGGYMQWFFDYTKEAHDKIKTMRSINTFSYASWADVTVGGWVVHFQKNIQSDDGKGSSNTTSGKGLAELYCHYPDQ